MNPRERILELVGSGAISAAEGDELIAALAGPRPSRWWALVDPTSGPRWPVVLAGVAAVALAVVLGHRGIWFDGVLDVHLGRPLGRWPAVVNAVLPWPITAGALWLAARLTRGRHARLGDVVATVAASRATLTLLGVVGLTLPAGAARAAWHPLEVATGLAVIGGLALAVTQLLVGYRSASGLSGVRWVAGLVLATASAEVAIEILHAAWVRA